MSIEANKAVVRRMIEEAWNNGNLDMLDEICAPDYVLVGQGGVADLRAGIAATRDGFPDWQTTIADMVAEGDRVAFRWTMRGTHQGEFGGIASTGKPAQFTGITIVRFAGGKIVEDRFESGSPDIKQQLL